MKKILILGGEGFIGKNIIHELSTFYTCFSVGNEISKENSKKRVFIEADPYQDKIDEKYDVIIHLIDKEVDLGSLPKSEYQLIKNINISPNHHLILFSSASIYADPGSDYARRKLLFEETYEKYCAQHNINLTIFRLFNVYGRYQIPYRRGSLIANIFNDFLKGETTLINDPDAQRDFMYAPDIARFIAYTINNGFYGTTDLGTEKLLSISNLIGILEKEVIQGKLKLSYSNISETKICPLAQNKLIGKIQLTSLNRGLQDTYNYYRLCL